jgi:hypothetical protein
LLFHFYFTPPSSVQAGKERARRAVLRHGEYTKEARAKHKEVMDLIKTSKDMLNRL